MGPNRIMISGVSDTATPNGCLEPVTSRTSGLTTGLLMDVLLLDRPKVTRLLVRNSTIQFRHITTNHPTAGRRRRETGATSCEHSESLTKSEIVLFSVTTGNDSPDVTLNEILGEPEVP